MTKLGWNRLTRLLALIAVMRIPASRTVGKARNRQAAHANKVEVARLTGKVKTMRVGRFLVDLAEQARITLTSARVGGFTAAGSRETLDGFHARLAEREAQIKAKPDRLGGNRHLEVMKEVRGDGGMTGKPFVHGRTVQEGSASDGRGTGRYRYDGVAVEALMHGHGVSVDLRSDSYFPRKVGKLKRVHELHDSIVYSCMREGAAIGMWDRISSSIRVRPTEERKPGKPAASGSAPAAISTGKGAATQLPPRGI